MKQIDLEDKVSYLIWNELEYIISYELKEDIYDIDICDIICRNLNDVSY